MKRSAKDGCPDSIKRTSEELIMLYEELVEEFPIVSIEDGLFEDDWEALAETDETAGWKNSACWR